MVALVVFFGGSLLTYTGSISPGRLGDEYFHLANGKASKSRNIKRIC